MYIKAAFEHQATSHLPWGELWLGTQVFEELGLEDNLETHLALCREAGMDFVSLPIVGTDAPAWDYRAFQIPDIESAAGSGLLTVVILDGPFQRLAGRMGLQATLVELVRNPTTIRHGLQEEAKKTRELVVACAESGAEVVVVADDIAYDRNTYFSVTVFRELLYPLYLELAEQIHRKGAYAVFHSDGNIANIVPDLLAAKFDGLACQKECMNLIALKRAHGASLTLFTGMSYELLNTPVLTPWQRKQFIEETRELSHNGGLVLSSSTGLNSARMLFNGRELREVLDENLAEV